MLQPFLKWGKATQIFCLVILTQTGCSSLKEKREQQDILEAELRQQERHIQELKADVERKELLIQGMDLELERMHHIAAGRQQAGEPPVPGVVKEIVLGRLTGGFRSNPRLPYDDALQFLIEPRDMDGHSIKAPGSLHIELFEITAEGLKLPLTAFDIAPRELRRSWDQPMLGSPAYRILVPIKIMPKQEKMRVVIRFTTLDGKPYEAERDFTLRLPGPGQVPVLPMGAAVPGGYTVVTPGHMINGKLVSPFNNQSNTASPVPAATGTVGSTDEMGRTPVRIDNKTEGPPPAVPLEPKPKQADKEENKFPVIPIIPLNPRDTPSTLPGILSPDQKVPPPLPPPPTPPEFDKNIQQAGYEPLPAPSELPRTPRPLFPSSTPTVQQMGSFVPVTASPPLEWRQKHAGVEVLNQAELPAIKLSRPVRIQ
jgi:hypothetical protein